MKINGILILALFAVIMPVSCGLAMNDMPPYVITRPVFEISGQTYHFSYAGIVFNFLNTTEKTVNSITASFMLFDPKTNGNPFIGSNVFEITKTDLIPPNASSEIILSMDRYIYVAPQEPYIIDNFYISEIKYQDGSVWRDKYGLYGIRTIK